MGIITGWKRIYLTILLSTFFLCIRADYFAKSVRICRIQDKDGVTLQSPDDENKPKAVVSIAKKLLGIGYKYGAASPSHGFDCSGFVYYVFKQIDITIPRSSSAIGQVGKTIPLSDAKAGDIILFTGTNPARRSIGHVGIVLSNDNKLCFIHASSGKAQAVTETMLEGSYKKRFMKVVRVLGEQNVL
ncbi:C40 family peptidase [Sphingobacterium sp. LRF_L2]|uniref:C40 family peptidase n=1 Tax=Sphingobacterium sp. LRF_L2 TaxID=3369421 RepID=UPI003F601B2B